MFFYKKQPKTDKGAENLERMCGKLMLMLKKKPPLKIENELIGLVGSIEKSPPCSSLDVKRIENTILVKLEEVKILLDTDGSRTKIIELTSDVALLLIRRATKCEKHERR